MLNFSVRTLCAADAVDLLRFELENRAWFEQHVEPRLTTFFSSEGVNAHIAELLELHARGEFHPFVLIDSAGRIVGRANLKAIDSARGSAELGYRVGQNYVGKGLASFAVGELLQQATQRWHLRQLEAFVSEANQASARVLLKHDFVRAELQPGLARVQGQTQDCWRYVRELAAQ
ncbi:GNAT family protein [Paucibacter sp. AS339]|uniref:GNAT family N-acetyltransferase n=1 Tax=Paucibacter hankyongi TaxID=3133434 RepID=UPI00309AC7E3